MRKPLIAGNWKMHFSVPEGLEYALQLRREVERYADTVDVVILPPALMLWEIANALRGCAIEVGAQNAAWARIVKKSSSSLRPGRLVTS